MKELQELAGKLLADGTVKVVIGWEEGRTGVRPVLITDPAQSGRLVFNSRCVHNLATYLNPRRSHIKKLGKVAVVVKGCDARAVAGLIRETQIKREELVILGVRCGGVVRRPDGPGELTVETVADKCPTCNAREPKLVDHLLGALPPPPPASTRRDERLRQLMALTPAARLEFWRQELTRCTRCHACREACPLCYCERCVVDKTRPQWVAPSPHAEGTLSWQLVHGLHLAGRCTDCGECERACPADIPLMLINRFLQLKAEERFGYTLNDDPAVPSPIGAFRTDDQQEFIL